MTENSYLTNAVSSDQYKTTADEEQKQKEEPATEQPPANQGGWIWRMGSGAVNLTKGAVGGTIGLGVGAVKLVGNTSYAVVAKTAEVGKNATVAVATKSYGAVSGTVGAVTSKLPSVPLPNMPSMPQVSLPKLKRGKDKEE